MEEKSPLILLVDDEPWNIKVLESFLDGRGYRLKTAADGEEALRAVETEPPDLVLLDIMMPGMDGLEVCKRLKGGKETMFIPVVMVTSLDHKLDRIAAINAGADDFITKPVDRAELVARVGSLLRMKSYHDDLEDKYKEIIELQIMKDNLMYKLVRDFRNPLVGILSYLETINANIRTKGYENLEQHIYNSLYLARQMTSLVSDLMELTPLKKDMPPLELDKTGLIGVVKENLMEFRDLINEKRLKVELVEETKDVCVNADKTLLTRVLGNMLDNAVRYSLDEGVITLRVAAAGGMASLFISDKGPGMLPCAQDKVFENFFQNEIRTSATRAGSGLGLAFCDMVIRAHGGELKAENNPDGGCSLTITLPAL